MNKIAKVTTVVLVLAGCATVVPTPTAKVIGPLPPVGGKAVTRSIGVISDTQIHESRGTASRYASKAGDEFVEVTIRTGQQVIGSTDILAQALQGLSGVPLVMHVGDAMDVSCQTEWDAFSRTMAVSARSTPWVLVGGNHDGYYVGNISPSVGTKYNVGYWDQVCNQGRYSSDSALSGRHFDKAKVVKANLQHVADLQGWANADVQAVPTRGKCEMGPGVVACAAWHVDEKRPWISFVTQLVRLPQAEGADVEVFALVLDSSTYDQQPNVDFKTALLTGVTAGFTSEQLSAARDMVNGLPKGSRFFLVTHHNVRQWNVGALSAVERELLTGILNSRGFLRFILTGHTHEGGWYDQTLLGTSVIELNTGSLADPPLYYRDLQFFMTDRSKWLVKSNRTELTLKSLAACDGYVSPKDGSGYSVDEQRSENDRLHKAPAFVRQLGRWGSAIKRFFAFWEAKHDELAPQLLTYRDVIRASLPEDASFSYTRWEGESPRTYQPRRAIEERLEYLSNCHDGERCSVTEKGNLLKKLEDDFSVASTVYPADIIAKAHTARLCAAVAATEESGKEDAVVEKVLEWSKPTEVELVPAS